MKFRDFPGLRTVVAHKLWVSVAFSQGDSMGSMGRPIVDLSPKHHPILHLPQGDSGGRRPPLPNFTFNPYQFGGRRPPRKQFWKLSWFFSRSNLLGKIESCIYDGIPAQNLFSGGSLLFLHTNFQALRAYFSEHFIFCMILTSHPFPPEHFIFLIFKSILNWLLVL